MLDGALRMLPGLCGPPGQPQPPASHDERGHERIKPKRHDQGAMGLTIIQPYGLGLVGRGAGVGPAECLDGAELRMQLHQGARLVGPLQKAPRLC